MNIERQENITVEQDRFFIQLKTEQTTTQSEVFPSMEEARKRKNSTQWKETGMAVLWGGGGVAGIVQGLEHIVTAADKGSFDEVILGVQLVALGIFFLGNLEQSVNARGLAKRQLERLQSTVSRIGRSQKNTPPNS
ncbi:hypothetical protein A3A48_00785 [Candidatus Curtissbacteria bacterium RIFCSPLOWO2_01_FULL_37_9]|uniref:Uncharacterized protein n=1 Tax=Candidatus Curtissbacteria bacterium RIFCSPLOWO2_01_FULL_37_9 TaxID=1797724 RepID=A0A1F5GUL4_9BACT|nr:MAG: hypothetical protein A3A48_00785 [Candidatus Curtissbacteria bacterium RIFCSPLOWO2_01_FULL_37_9]